MDDKEVSAELYRSVLAFAQQAINFCFLLNGGAIIGLLTFLGNVPPTGSAVALFRVSIAFFVLGVFLATLSSIVGYLTQFAYFKEQLRDARPFPMRGTDLRRTLMLLLVLSVCSFGMGSYFATAALTSQ